jgi:2-oxoglutarate ferredoxin oxidoreductase subunit alpha
MMEQLPTGCCDSAPLTRGARNKPLVPVTAVTIRFAGDSGDGMQLVGTQFSDVSALAGNDISTLPDYPSEIRAPAGTLAGVSGYQIQFASDDVFTPGDEVDTLVAMNPAALRANLSSVKLGGYLIVNENAFTSVDVKKAGYQASPIDGTTLADRRLVKVPIDRLTSEALKSSGLTPKEIDRCKNFFALGLICWLYDRPLEPTLKYIEDKFGKKKPAYAAANATVLRTGHNWGENAELFPVQFTVDKAKLPPGKYRKLTGNEGAALGLVTAAKRADKTLFFGGYPITPATDILHHLCEWKQHGVVTFQAEDEICAIGSAIGASYGGALAVTATSGPGLALKTEAMGLAVMTELPLVIINVQRGGPSTGLPTKVEQSDLLQAVVGRNGECPMPVIAATGPADCYHATLEASIIAMRYMTPVMVLSDGFIANSAEPWLVPDISAAPKIEISHPRDPATFKPYGRDEILSRPWAIPGTPGLEHRIGGLEKEDGSGNLTTDPANHHRMVKLRAAKVAGTKPEGASFIWTGPEKGDLLLLGWGGTHGAIKAATLELRKAGLAVSACQIRYVNPLSPRLGELLPRFGKVLVPELNLGQLAMLIKAQLLIDVIPFSKVRGQPFMISELVRAAKECLAGSRPTINNDTESSAVESEG